MKILITGTSGFIGSRLANKMQEKGHEVTGIVNKNQPANSKINLNKLDITDNNLELPDETYDVVYHLAGVNPLEKNKKVLKKVNYDGTVNFFNKVKDKTKFFVYISGLGVFGDVGNQTIDEKTPLNPNTDYAKIRLDAQRFLETKCKDKSIPFTVAYLGEVYGNGGWYLNQVIERLRNGKFRVPKGGEYYRSYVHVDDVVSALIAIGEKNALNESFIITDSYPALFRDFINFTGDKLGIKHPGSIPVFLAKAVLGSDSVKLLTTSLKASNAKIKQILEFKFPSYKEGVPSVISELNLK